MAVLAWLFAFSPLHTHIHFIRARLKRDCAVSTRQPVVQLTKTLKGLESLFLNLPDLLLHFLVGEATDALAFQIRLEMFLERRIRYMHKKILVLPLPVIAHILQHVFCHTHKVSFMHSPTFRPAVSRPVLPPPSSAVFRAICPSAPSY